ncbi:hypothetical protein [Brevundimonas sp.]|uniref:hypothetical protein n=1 Tax=Brevundimonas sp. TaxID=1871086 RepID=UPI001E1087B1|nr:hypothetical protein [Brevundimonas sp.]MBL0948740.1 HPF/RaiA family ribosome-associated protein [Brevundimonas sp.]
MQIQINTTNDVDGRAALLSHAEDQVRQRLSRFESRLTRIEMHLGDENGARNTAGDKRCVLEARPTGLAPVTVTDHGNTLEEAMSGALKKMVNSLETTFGKLATH